MGWSSLSERCMKGCLGFKIRIERMSENRWVKKGCDHVGSTRSKGLSHANFCEKM